MFCSKCGIRLLANTSFCSNCGQQLASMNESTFQKRDRLLREINPHILQKDQFTPNQNNIKINNSSKHETKFFWGIVGLVIFLVSVTSSWLTVKFFTISLSFTLADIYNTFISTLLLAQDMSNNADSIPQIFPMTDQSSDSQSFDYVKPLLGFIFTIIVYPIVVVLGIISVVRKRNLLFLITGILAISVSVSWVISVLNLKSSMMDSGGDSFSGMIMSFDFGFGSIVALIGGIIMIITSLKSRK